MSSLETIDLWGEGSEVSRKYPQKGTQDPTKVHFLHINK